MLNRTKPLAIAVAFVLLTLAQSSQSFAAFFGPSPYLSFADSPFSGGSFTYFHLETFEDSLFNTPGVSVDNGLVSPPGAFTSNDSVDADDGTIDGHSNAGNMYNFQNPTTKVNAFTFTFDANVLGSLPTHAGIVWTDGTPGGLVTFEAFDENGSSLGTLSANLGDGSFFGTTAEDRFFGASNLGGISKIFITDNGSPNDVDIDHLQYGGNNPTSEVPEPASLIIWGVLGAVGLLVGRRCLGSQCRTQNA